MLLSFGIIANAAELPSGCQDYVIVNSGETAVKEALAVEKLETLGVSPAATTSTTTWSHLPGTYWCYVQRENAFCMAACTQSVLNYLTGNTYDQYEIAEDLGVDPENSGNFNNIRPYLNEKQDENYYVAQSYTTTIDTMKSNLYSAVTVYQAPAVLRIVVTGSGWPYTTNGHAVNVNAARDDKAYFQLADPAIKRIDPNGNPFYQKTASSIHTAVTYNQYCGYIF